MLLKLDLWKRKGSSIRTEDPLKKFQAVAKKRREEINEKPKRRD
jgi:hypothetical protein